ncbi:MAG: Asp-tRNA(Asn)/Glu-tRNA(Gln) amidotransferase subunit GatB [Polyangiales bacterium]
MVASEIAVPSTEARYEAVIGLEVHAQLLTKTKQFCACATTFGADPNTHVCPVCLGLPGALPVLNAASVEMAVRAALALGCTIRKKSIFSRKNYFYPDLPKGYQISQFDEPFSEHGELQVVDDAGAAKRVGITRIHLEEDAGKNLHGVVVAAGRSVVDLNRAGTPLIEIVSEPDLRSSGEAVSYLKRLRDVLIALEVNDGNLEEGSFRCDVNVSVRLVGSERFGTRVEVKNVNSFRNVQKAIEHEIKRQTEIVRDGKSFKQHTRQWDDDAGQTIFLREKEGSDDYRYFPEPDLPPLVLDDAFVAAMKTTLPELPLARHARYVEALRLTAYDADVLTGHPRISDFFERSIASKPSDAAWAKRAANFIMTEVLADVSTHGLGATFPVAPSQIAEILTLVDAGTISGKQAKELYAKIKGTSQSPETVARESGMAQVSDEGVLTTICAEVIAANPKQVASYRAGKTGTLGFLVGQVMKETKGSANPAVVNELLKKALEQS